MSMDINRNTAGMMNKDVNLYDKAVELSRDGNLSAKDVKTLEKIAKSDGNFTGTERVLIDDLKSSGGAETFAHFAKGAKFDPSGFSWNIDQAKTTVKSGDKNIELVFSDAPSSAKEMKGDIAASNATMETMIPDNKKSAWVNVNKHNINDVKNFVEGLNLSPADKATFIQSYMTANYNHPGIDIKWDGAGLQEGIDAVPSDENGRKYMDCESFAKIAETLLGGTDSNFTTLGVASGASGSKRDHQVAVLREGNDAYVISNNEIKRVSGGASKSDEELVGETFSDFSNVIVDRNGAMKADTSAYSTGDSLTSDDGSTITISSIDTATTMRGNASFPDGSSVPVEVTVDENNGSYAYTSSAKAGDTITTSNGTTITMSDDSNAVATLPDGSRRNVTVAVSPDGSLNIQPR